MNRSEGALPDVASVHPTAFPVGFRFSSLACSDTILTERLKIQTTRLRVVKRVEFALVLSDSRGDVPNPKVSAQPFSFLVAAA